MTKSDDASVRSDPFDLNRFTAAQDSGGDVDLLSVYLFCCFKKIANSVPLCVPLAIAIM